MTGKTKYMVKMILAVLLILAAPVLFFSSIGGNPLQVRESIPRAIAVVNEDNGSEKDAEAVEFGKEVAAILGEDSDFTWTVIGRSAAVNGLKNNTYDAVVYIPSNFSESIMTYDSMQPVRADFNYQVQSQVAGLHREKGLREIETATSRVNQRISSLYWSYVSRDMEHIRKEFDQILQKEIDFLGTMSAFYKPSSKNLAGELDQQRSMLEQLQSTMKSAGESAASRQNSVKQLEQNLASFVDHVDTYKEYQNKQQQLLANVQQESITTIRDRFEGQGSRHSESKDLFAKDNDELSVEMKNVEKQVVTNTETVKTLYDERENQVDFQTGKLAEEIPFFIYSSTLDELQGKIFEKRPGLGGVEIASKPGEGEGKEDKDPDLTEEQKTLGDLVELIGSIKDGIIQLPVPKPDPKPTPEPEPEPDPTLPPENPGPGTGGENGGVQEAGSAPAESEQDPITDPEPKPEPKPEPEPEPGESPKMPIIKKLDKLIGDIEKVSSSLGGKGEAYKSILGKLRTDILGLENEKNLFNMSVDEVQKEIKTKENSILSSKVLSDNRKKELESIFGSDIKQRELNSLIEYYAYIEHFEATLDDMLINEKKEEKDKVASVINPIVAIKESEKGMWEDLELNQLPRTQEGMKMLQDMLALMSARFSKNMEDYQKGLQDDLKALTDKADTVLNTIQEVPAKAPTANPGSDGTSVISTQQTVGQELLSMNDLVVSLGERQDQIVNDTSNLQSKVQSVQNDADTLNTKWAANVDSTKKFKDDVTGLLGNTYVNGQTNKPVFEHLANPVKVKGDAPVKEEVKKVPPVVILVIILVSSLLIGFFAHYFRNAPMLMQVSLLVLLSLIVGMIISLYGLKIYSLDSDRAIEWSIFTILLVLASSAFTRAAFSMGQVSGWLASVLLIVLFVSPLLIVAAPNINLPDPLSNVYMSIQYEAESLFLPGVAILAFISVLMLLIPVAFHWKNSRQLPVEEQVHEA